MVVLSPLKEQQMAAHVVVVANVTAASSDLIAAIKDRAAKSPIEVTLLMPGQGPGLAGKEAVRGRLDEALAMYREAGIEAEGVCGDANPFDAVAECWDPRFHDEVIVSTLPGQSSRWISSDLPARIRKLTGAPVTHVVAHDMRPEPTVGPAPEHETSPLGPLGVLAWGGRASK
jgi:hypothetical protein